MDCEVVYSFSPRKMKWAILKWAILWVDCKIPDQLVLIHIIAIECLLPRKENESNDIARPECSGAPGVKFDESRSKNALFVRFTCRCHYRCRIAFGGLKLVLLFYTYRLRLRKLWILVLCIVFCGSEREWHFCWSRCRSCGWYRHWSVAWHSS